MPPPLMPTRYYIAINQEPHGPYTVEQLEQHVLHAHTLVWAQGWATWKPAHQVPALAALIEQAPPPLPQAPYAPQTPPATQPPPAALTSRQTETRNTERRPAFGYLGAILICVLAVASHLVSARFFADPAYQQNILFLIGIAVVQAVFLIAVWQTLANYLSQHFPIERANRYLLWVMGTDVLALALMSAQGMVLAGLEEELLITQAQNSKLLALMVVLLLVIALDIIQHVRLGAALAEIKGDGTGLMKLVGNWMRYAIPLSLVFWLISKANINTEGFNSFAELSFLSLVIADLLFVLLALFFASAWAKTIRRHKA